MNLVNNDDVFIQGDELVSSCISLNRKINKLAQQIGKLKESLSFDNLSCEILRRRTKKAAVALALLEQRLEHYQPSLKTLAASVRRLNQASALQAKSMAQKAQELEQANHRALHDALTGLPNRR